MGQYDNIAISDIPNIKDPLLKERVIAEKVQQTLDAPPRDDESVPKILLHQFVLAIPRYLAFIILFVIVYKVVVILGNAVF